MAISPIQYTNHIFIPNHMMQSQDSRQFSSVKVNFIYIATQDLYKGVRDDMEKLKRKLSHRVGTI